MKLTGRLLGKGKPGSWVKYLTGLDPKYGFAGKFLDSEILWDDANDHNPFKKKTTDKPKSGTGTKTFNLDDGVYDIQIIKRADDPEIVGKTGWHEGDGHLARRFYAIIENDVLKEVPSEQVKSIFADEDDQESPEDLNAQLDQETV